MAMTRRSSIGTEALLDKSQITHKPTGILPYIKAISHGMAGMGTTLRSFIGTAQVSGRSPITAHVI